jgi:hypothetical protein
MKGGAKLIEKNGEKLSGFQPVERMISSNSAVISLLTNSSLKGFMYRLNVSEDDTYYNGLSERGNRFSKPITDFILKIVIIRKKSDDNLGNCEGIDKASESNMSFFEESKLQMKIWKESISGGFPEICPSVANLALFDNENSINFIECIQKKEIYGSLGYNILGWIVEKLKSPKNKVGVLLMPTVNNSTTFWDFIQVPGHDDMVYYLAAQVVRLFIICKTIHFDLHENNSLVKNGKESIIIDFGRASDLANGEDDEYLGALQKKSILKYSNILYNELIGTKPGETIDSFNDPIAKNTYMLKVIEYIYNLDVVKNRALFGTGVIQMQGWNSRINPDELYKAFDILKTLVSTSEVHRSKRTVKSMTEHGELINFDDIDTFKVPFECNVQTSPNEGMVGKIVRHGKNLFFCVAGAAACYYIANSASFLGKSGGTSKRKIRKNKTKRKYKK